MEHPIYGRRMPAVTAMKVKTLSKAETDSLPGIQLNDRQMKLYKARKSGGGTGMKAQNHSMAPPPPPQLKKTQYGSWKKTSSRTEQQQPYLGREPTETAETVPNTFSEDSASNASYSSRTSSHSNSRRKAANAFYGQRLNSQERKRYDDQGNTWSDSQSEASSAAASSVSKALSATSSYSRASSRAASTASSKAPSSTGSSLGSMARLRQLQQQRTGSSAMSSAGSHYSSSKSAVSVGSNSSRSAVSVASSAKMSSASRSVVSSSSRYASTSIKPKALEPASPSPQEDEIMNQTAAFAVENRSSVSVGSRSNRSALSVSTKSQRSFSQKIADRKSAEKPTGLVTQKDKSKFLRSSMMQWAKSSSSSSSSSVISASSALKSTRSSASTSSRSSKSSRRLSFAPKKSVIHTDYRSPRSMASGAISPKEMAIMRKVADRNKRSSNRKSMSPLNKNPRRAAGKVIKSRMKKLLSSSSSSVSSSSSHSKEPEQREEPRVETVTVTAPLKQKSSGAKLYDDSGHTVIDDAPDDEAASIMSNESPKVGEVNRRKPIVMEEDVFEDDGQGDDDKMIRNKEMRKKNKRGRSSIFKSRIGNIGMGVMDDLIESNDELSSDDDEEEYSSAEEEEEATADFNDEHDVSIHQARSVKSAITPRKPQQEDYKDTSTTPRTINNILDENKEFLEVMREGPLKQAMNTPSMRRNFSDPVPTMSESFDAEAEEYRTFTNALKAELSGTHSKLYDSFLSMFRFGEHGNNEPQKPLSVYPGSLDLQTKDSISKMSKYLNTEHDVECLISSQIVKDADVRNFVFSYEYEKPKKNRGGYGGAIEQVPSTDSINGGDDGSQFEVTVSQHARSVVSSTNDSRYMSASKVKSTSIFKLPPSAAGTGSGTNFNNIKLKSRAVNTVDKKTEAVPSSWTKVRLKPVSKPKTNGRPSISTDAPETAEFHRIVLRKTPTNAGMALQTAPSSLTDASGTENKPIDLDKTGGAAAQPIKLTTPTPATQKPVELSPVSGVSGTEMKPIPVKDTRKGAEENPIKLAPSTGYDEGHPIQLVPSKGDESANPIVLAPSIDLDLNEGSIMIPLEKEEEAGKDIAINVIVGKNGITKVQSVPGQESTKANVMWRLERKEVKSALLDMSTFSVKVIVSSDSNDKDNKDLRFPTSAQCMKFANALHEMKNSTSNKNALKSIDEAKTSTGTNEDTSSVYVEQLSDEEQKVLDEFRQRKKNPPPPESSDGTDFMKELLTKNLLDKHNGKSDESKPMSVVNGGAPSSPVSEVSSVTSMSGGQSQIEKKYQLMLKMKVPKEAVKGKMEQDGVDPSIIAKVLGEEAPAKKPEAPSSGGSNLSPEDEKKATVYRKMLKMMVPPEAVAHKMKKEGVDPKIVAAVLGDGSGDDQAAKMESSSALPSLTIPEQAAAQKYQKMLKMNVPKEAVEHKMKKDGADAKIIAFVLGQSASAPNGDAAPTKNKKGSSLTSAEESTASAYRRMLKMNIPKEAVHHKMMKDGVSEKIISAVLKNNKKDNGKDSNKEKKGGFNAGGFHWNAIDDNVSIVGSVWSKAKTASEVGASLPDLDLISKHVEEFQKKPDNAVEAKKSTAKSGQGGKEMANVINSNRAQNVAITLKAFNDFTYKELSQSIEFLDPFGKIKGDRALFMKDLLPTAAEVKAIKAYTGSDDNLDLAERWFRQIVNVKRAEGKVQVMRTMETFKMDAIMLGKSFQLLTDVCNQVMSSDRLPDLLDMVRQIGNRMNQGRGDDAAGFKLDFLPRLAQTKGSDKKTTALDLVVLIFCTRNQREALMLSDDYPDIQEASRMEFNDLTADVRSLEGSFNKCKAEFKKLQEEHDASLVGRPPPSRSKVPLDSRSESALMKPSRQGSARKFSGNDINTEISHRRPSPMKPQGGLSLMDSIKSRNGMVKESSTPTVGEVLTAIQKSNEEVRRSMSPRASLLASFEAKDQGKQEFSLEASIRRLEKFVGEVNYVILPKLESQRTEAVQACKDLAAFFCEAPSEKAASNLLKILAGFATGIDQAVRKYDEQQKILARKEAAMKKRNKKDSKSNDGKGAKKSKMKLNPLKKMKKRPTPEAPPKPTPAEASAAGEKKSLVLMVNEMLKVAGDKEIADYVSGNTSATAGSRLEKIYQEEKSRKASDKEDILTAIQRRRSVSTTLVPEQALSDLSATLSRDEAIAADRRKSRAVNRWSSRKSTSTTSASALASDESGSGSLPPRKGRATNRWSSKGPAPTPVSQSQPDTPVSVSLSSISEEANDAVIQKKRRQSVVNRWASKSSTSPKAEAAAKNDDKNDNDDIADDESDIGEFEAMLDKRKQKAFNRWGSKR